MNKELLLKITDSGLLKLNQPTTVTAIVQILSGISFFETHNDIIKSGSAIVILVASLYNWFRNEITKADLINDIK
jgi:hypothetical protein